ncbi:MFS transporter [Agromyces mangrovi Wang et al. 2018]|uniref:MFS transporter n=1 Tax=Agromyces mangrovi TaxID=1858653 RepID=UPI00257403A0|nr:MFS transporter [Agromyces mangrovi]BDZ65079.1 putative glucitol transport protein GutA [Agromyces mangrovi]
MTSTRNPESDAKASTEDRAAEKALAKQDRVSIWRVIPWSAPAFSMNALIVLTGYFTIYATDTLALNPAIVGGLLVAAKIIDAVGALLSGWIVDRAPETRWGKARPFELSVIACWALTAFMFSTPGALGDVAKYAWIFTSYLFLTALFMPLFNANNALYTARVFPRRAQYGDVSAKMGLITVIVAIFITVGMPIAVGAAGKDPAAWSFVAICMAVPFTLIGLVRFWVFKERPDAPESDAEPVRLRDIFLVLRTNPYMWVLSAMSLLVGIYAANVALSYYFRYIVGDLALQGIVAISFVALIPLMFFFPALIRRFSVSRMIAVSSFLGAIGFLVMIFAGDNIPIIMVSSVLTALAALPVNFLAPILIIDNSTYNEWKGNRRLESVGGALYSFSSTVGQAIASGIGGAVLAIAGYNGVLDVQSAEAESAIVALASWIPAIFAALVGIVALYYHRLEGRIKEISAEVIARREQSATEATPGSAVGGTEAVRTVRTERNAPFSRRKND